MQPARDTMPSGSKGMQSGEWGLRTFASKAIDFLKDGAIGVLVVKGRCSPRNGYKRLSMISICRECKCAFLSTPLRKQTPGIDNRISRERKEQLRRYRIKQSPLKSTPLICAIPNVTSTVVSAGTQMQVSEQDRV